MWGNDPLEMGSTGSERIHPRQHKGDSLLNIPQTNGRQDSKEETSATRKWGCYLKEEGEEVWRHTEFFLFGTLVLWNFLVTVPGCK